MNGWKQRIVIMALGLLLLLIGVARLAFKPSPPPPDRYRADRDGETVRLVPVDPAQHAALLRRCRKTLLAARALVTDPRLPAGSYVYTPVRPIPATSSRAISFSSWKAPGITSSAPPRCAPPSISSRSRN